MDNKTIMVICDVSFTFKSCYIKNWQFEQKEMRNQENQNTKQNKKYKWSNYQLLSQTTLYSLKNKVIKKALYST